MAGKRMGWRGRLGAKLASAFALTTYLAIGGALPAQAGTAGCVDDTAGTLTVTLENSDNVTISLVSGAIHVVGVSEAGSTCTGADFAGITTLVVDTATPAGTTDETVEFDDAANAGWPGSVSVAMGAGTGDWLTLTGSSGSDSLSPTTPIDSLAGEERIDVYGGDGDDTIDFSAYAGPAASVFHGVQLYGEGDDDVLTGTSGADAIEGGSENDTILGGAGNDKLKGDYYSLVCEPGSIPDGGDDLIDGGAGDDSIYGGDDCVSQTGSGNDVLYGRAGADLIEGSDGNDWIEGGIGTDTMAGGDGDDTVSYRGSSRGVTVILNATQSASQNSDAKSDVLSGFENLSGSMKNDVLTGTSGANYIYGLGGDDQLNGGSGDDFLFGGAGTDVLNGEAGSDTCEGYGNTSKKNKDQYFSCGPEVGP